MVTGLIKCSHCKFRSAEEGRPKCVVCTKQNDDSRRRLAAKRKAAGVCRMCAKNPSLRGITMCDPCRIRANQWAQNAAMRKKYGYGFTMAERLKLFEKQGGFCAFCGLHMQKNRFHVDHCHLSGKIRGAVHMKCNIAIGIYENCGGKVFIANIKAYLGDPL